MTRPEARTPFRLDHVAVAVPSGPAATPFLVGELGGARHAAGPGMGFRFWQYRYEGGGLLELLEPDGPPGGFLHRFLEQRGPGIHHVTFKVPDLHAAIERAADHDYQVVNVNEDFPGWKEAFLHPKQAQGIVVQLAQSDGGDPPPGMWPFPPEPEPAASRATLVGVCLAARSEERARHQWEGLLGGACKAEAGELRFRWPESPLRIGVRIDPDAAEGPLHVELGAPRAAGLPDGPHPVLGVRFAAPPG